MDEIKWKILDEVAGNATAELIGSYLEAHEIPVMLSQEGAGHLVFPVSVGLFGKVQILVPIDKFEQAEQLLEDFHISNASEIESDIDQAEEDEL